MKTKYSVVIPHYESAKMLGRMLKSIPERDDIQIIVVDDCSSLKCQDELRLLQHCGLELVFQKENRGAGAARNVGLKHAKGEWVIVVDADDVFSPNAFDVFDKNISNDIDYLCFCIKCVDANLEVNGVKIVSDQSVRKYLAGPNRSTERYLKYKNTVCWNKLVSLKYIRENGIHFEECEVNNDVMYAIWVCCWTNRFKVIKDELYSFVVNASSLTHKKRSIEREFLFYLQAQKRNGIFKKLKYGYPFYRMDILYIPFLIKKRGFGDMVRFFVYRHKHIDIVNSAKKEYLFLLDGHDKNN